MTTIVCTANAMAADTRVSWTEGDVVYNTSFATKVYRVGDELVGMAGDTPSGLRLLEWMRNGGKGRKPKLTKDTAAVRLNRDGIFTFDGRDPEWLQIDAKFFAIGSGARWATGAMEMGADLRKAVEVAMKYDPATGGTITVLDLIESKS